MIISDLSDAEWDECRARLREISEAGGVEVQGVIPGPENALCKLGMLKEVAVGAGGYMLLKITLRGLDALI